MIAAEARPAVRSSGSPPTPPDGRPADEGPDLVALFVEHAACDGDDPRRPELRDRLVVAHLPVARNIARRFARRGEPTEDLEQVATVGLMHAVDRFDPGRERDFLSYAVPTIMGEVRRYFRDSTWSVRTPRSVKDRYLAVGAATGSLAQRLGRAPTAAEIAEHLGLTRDEVAEALAAHGSHHPASLDETLGQGEDSSLVNVLGALDPELDHVEVRALVRGLVAGLPARERTILALRFVHERTQAEIANRLCISQMHVSRLLARTLAQLRAQVEHQRRLDDAGPPERAA